jgi:hypothetical protein
MHQFLRSVGFSKLTKADLEKLFEYIIKCPTAHKVATDSEGNEFAEISKEFGDFFGITVRGIYRENDMFEVEYYFPYLCGKTISTKEYADVEKHAEKESYAGICDEIRIGVTLIFYLQNVVDYLSMKKCKGLKNSAEGIILGGLSTEGKILLAVNKAERQMQNIRKEGTDRNYLIAAARDGDEEAIESLTLEDIDMYSLLSRRITHEDILSIVDSYFMPYGVESDHYSILGEIMDYSVMQNQITKENIYTLDLICNDMIFSVCINETDLFGEPAVGRRFKGVIWMQGSIKYRD